jgi:hypothetical protein
VTLTKGTKTKTMLSLSHHEIRRLLDAMQGTDEPLTMSRWDGIDRKDHARLIHRLQRADRRFSLYES